MSWKDIIKAPPFDVKPVFLEAKQNSRIMLKKILTKKIDQRLKNHINKFPNKNRFTLPMDMKSHEELVNLVGGEEQLENAIKEFYNLHDFYIKLGAIPGHTSGSMAYYFELM
jgi:hypothetical protein